MLASKGISEAEMHELGLIAVPEDKSRRSHDFFRDRVIIPIMDKRGRVIAFGGRIMGDGQPKYLNSPETPVFNKRRVLYNLNHARDKAFEARNIIICEGYMDVIAMDKYGIEYAVAPLGTALTEDQIQEAWRVCPMPTLCFDGDSAGIRAAVRSVDRALPILKAGYSTRYAFLPDKMDPDEYLKAKGRDEFLKIIGDTVPLAELVWRKNIQSKDLSTPEQKALIEKNIMEEVGKIADEKVRGYYIQEMKNRIYEEFGRGAWKDRRGGDSRRKASAAAKKPVQIRPKPSLDELVLKFVLAAFVYYPELIPEYEEKCRFLTLIISECTLCLTRWSISAPKTSRPHLRTCIKNLPNAALTKIWQACGNWICLSSRIRICRKSGRKSTPKLLKCSSGSWKTKSGNA